MSLPALIDTASPELPATWVGEARRILSQASTIGEASELRARASAITIEVVPAARPKAGPMKVYMVIGCGELLYIGQTGHVRRRLIQHRYKQPEWWRYAKRVLVVDGLTRDEAHRVESSWIDSFQPVYNVQYNRSDNRMGGLPRALACEAPSGAFFHIDTDQASWAHLLSAWHIRTSPTSRADRPLHALEMELEWSWSGCARSWNPTPR